MARLCAAHVAFERGDPVPADLASRLEPVLFPAHPRAWCIVADPGGEPIGYATYAREFSTWQAAEHVHLDCLFVTEPHRGEAWGRNGAPLEQLHGLLRADRVGDDVPEPAARQRLGARAAGRARRHRRPRPVLPVVRRRAADRQGREGHGGAPQAGARRCWAMRPPAECPMRTGGMSKERTIRS
ncbi:GNAT family N-acetyltransferase [Kitasatospora sp. NPDC017646]|uniref:GNAT family N-acetyltransferase n=1 Tax=Kitasatospora sp. NPDC017646 TaxID=3364024 RepID=UPI0037A69E92